MALFVCVNSFLSSFPASCVSNLQVRINAARPWNDMFYLLTGGDQVHPGAVAPVCVDGTGVNGARFVDILERWGLFFGRPCQQPGTQRGEDERKERHCEFI